MKKEQIVTDKCGAYPGPFPQGVSYGNFVFTTQIGSDLEGNVVPGGITSQTKQLLDNVKNVLEAAGSSLENILNITIYVVSMSDVPAMNEVYKSYFPDHYPARCCVQCAGMAGEAVVEMQVLAYRA